MTVFVNVLAIGATACILVLTLGIRTIPSEGKKMTEEVEQEQLWD